MVFVRKINVFRYFSKNGGIGSGYLIFVSHFKSTTNDSESMDMHGHPLLSMDPHGHPWISMDVSSDMN